MPSLRDAWTMLHNANNEILAFVSAFKNVSVEIYPSPVFRWHRTRRTRLQEDYEHLGLSNLIRSVWKDGDRRQDWLRKTCLSVSASNSACSVRLAWEGKAWFETGKMATEDIAHANLASRSNERYEFRDYGRRSIRCTFVVQFSAFLQRSWVH